MKDKKIFYIILGIILFLLLGSSVYTNFIANSINVYDYVIIGQMFLGIVGVLVTLFLGLKVFPDKKNYQLLLFGFFEILFVLGLVVLNYVYGYHNIVDHNNYLEYMKYCSMEFNIFLYMIFAFIIGVLNLNLFIKEKFSSVEDANATDNKENVI